MALPWVEVLDARFRLQPRKDKQSGFLIEHVLLIGPRTGGPPGGIHHCSAEGRRGARASLVAENLALRQQLAVLPRQTRRPRLRPIDRAFWMMLLHVWSRWADTLAIV